MSDNIKPNLTIVSGLWDLSIDGRDFESHYLPRFEEFLKIPCNMVLFVPKSLEDYVWERRSRENTHIKIYELDDIKNHIFAPFWDKWQEIRTSPHWAKQATWLPSSPQATREHYFPIQCSKMFFMHDAKIWNIFDTDYFLWLDAGLTNTVNKDLFYNPENLQRITKYMDPFLFVSFPYEAHSEIHGFTFSEMNRYCGDIVKYVCRGGLWGGHRDFLSQANSQYYSLLERSISEGLGGADECLFTILTYLYPDIYKRFAINGDGLVVTFMNAINDDNVKLETVDIPYQKKHKPKVNDISDIKTNVYFLTFNSPEQLEYTINSLSNHQQFLEHPTEKVVIDNSTDSSARDGNAAVCEKYGFEHIIREENTGINEGRQFAANHFNDSDSDYYLFFEDDMTLAGPDYDGYFCRNGFRQYIPELYKKIHQIIIKEEFDFLKLSFTEVYMDNNMQTSWYNVPQDIRDRDWPHYNRLPQTGLDPNSPRTIFKHIERLEDGLTYITGDIYYSNWPMIVSKEGNKKMFIDTTWAHPYEQTWMSHMYELTKTNKLEPACLLASPVIHDRFKYYSKDERREN